MKSAVAGFVTNMAKNYLSLDRPRPPSHKGLQFAVDPTPATCPPAAAASQLLQGPPVLIHPVPAIHAPDLARILRYVCIAVDTPGLALRPGAKAFVVLHGLTMHSWYHTGSQVPWKRAIHLNVPVLGEDRDIDLVARSVFQALTSMVDGWWAGRGAAAAAGPIPHGEPAPAPAHSLTFQTNPDTIKITLFDQEGEPAPAAHPEPVSVVLFLQMSSAAPDGHNTLEISRRLKRVVIDGGNPSVFVYASKQDNMTTLAEYARQCAAQRKNPTSQRLQKQVTAAYNKIDIHKDWFYDDEAKTFARPGSIRRAFLWPPNLATVKLVAAVFLILLVAYVLGFTIIPRAGQFVAERRLRTKQRRILEAEGGSS